jgi:hypothetical protein
MIYPSQFFLISTDHKALLYIFLSTSLFTLFLSCPNTFLRTPCQSAT